MSSAAHPGNQVGQDKPLGPGTALLVSVFLVSLCVLAFEITLTRLFSVLLRYHYVFLVISIAICGLGVGGLIHHQLLAGWSAFRRSKQVLPGWYAVAFSLLLSLSILLLLRSPASEQLSSHLWIIILPFLCFTAAGMYLAEIFRSYGQQGGKIYFADLLGASLAAVAAIGLLHWAGAINTPFLLAMVAGVAAFIWWGQARNLPLLVGAIIVLLLGASLYGINRSGDRIRVPVQPQANPNLIKPLFRELADPSEHARIIDTQWSAFARTDLVEYGAGPPETRARFIFTDGETPSAMLPFSGDLRQLASVKNDLTYFPFRFGPVDSIFSLGPGGGLDILMGLLAGSRKITGVEINASTIKLMDKYSRYNGNIYHYPQVHIYLDDGRSFIRRSLEKYDLIIAALTQTATTGSAGVALVESYIHTLQAFADYRSHLRPQGRLALIVQEHPLLVRGLVTALTVMESQGLSQVDATHHLFAIGVKETEFAYTPYRYLLIWRKSAFTPQVSEEMWRAADRLGFRPFFIHRAPK